MKHSNHLQCCIELAKYLNKKVNTPVGIMILVEIYSNGNVACVPIKYQGNYFDALQEFHADSVQGID